MPRPVKEVAAAFEQCTGYTTSGLTPGFTDYERSEEDKQWVMYHQRDRLWGAKAGSLKAAVRGTTYINPVSCYMDMDEEMIDVDMKEVFGATEAAAVAATTAAAQRGYTHTGVTRSQRQVNTMFSSLAGLDGSSSKAAKKLPKVPKFDEVPSVPKAAAGTYHHQQQQRKVPTAPSGGAGTKRDRQGEALPRAADVTRPGATGAAGHVNPAGRPVAQQPKPIAGPLATAAAAQQQVVPNPHHMVAADHAVQESALKKIRAGAYSPAPQANSRSVSPAPGTPLGSEVANNLGGNSPAPSRSPSVGFNGSGNGNGYQQQQHQPQGPLLLPKLVPQVGPDARAPTSTPQQYPQYHPQYHPQQKQQQYPKGGMPAAPLGMPGRGVARAHNPSQQQHQQYRHNGTVYNFPEQQL
jgi:hypothetical protein